MSKASPKSRRSARSQLLALAEKLKNPKEDVIEEPRRELIVVGPKPFTVTCPVCNQLMKTRVRYTVTLYTHMACLVLCCCFCPLCFLPYFMGCCKDAEHYCSDCGVYLGSCVAFSSIGK